MKNTSTNPFSKGSFAFVIALTLFYLSSAHAAPINYGDFSGSTVMYLDVTETANTPGDTEPMYGPPSIFGNQLDFDPAGFSASSAGGLPDLTDGQLNFTLMGVPGAAITDIDISESGDYNLLGTGGVPTQIIYGVAITSITVLEVDGSALPVPVALAATSTGGGDDLSQGADLLTPWANSLSYDVNAALGLAGVKFVIGATKLEIAINNTLAALSEPSSIAFVAKKDFLLDISVEPFDPLNIPEPSTLILFGVAFCGMCIGGGILRE